MQPRADAFSRFYRRNSCTSRQLYEPPPHYNLQSGLSRTTRRTRSRRRLEIERDEPYTAANRADRSLAVRPVARRKRSDASPTLRPLAYDELSIASFMERRLHFRLGHSVSRDLSGWTNEPLSPAIGDSRNLFRPPAVAGTPFSIRWPCRSAHSLEVRSAHAHFK